MGGFGFSVCVGVVFGSVSVGVIFGVGGGGGGGGCSILFLVHLKDPS